MDARNRANSPVEIWLEIAWRKSDQTAYIVELTVIINVVGNISRSIHAETHKSFRRHFTTGRVRSPVIVHYMGSPNITSIAQICDSDYSGVVELAIRIKFPINHHGTHHRIERDFL